MTGLEHQLRLGYRLAKTSNTVDANSVGVTAFGRRSGVANGSMSKQVGKTCRRGRKENI